MLKGNIFSEIKNIGAGYGTIDSDSTEYADVIDTAPFNSVTLTWIFRSLSGDEGIARFYLMQGDGDTWPTGFSFVTQNDIIGPVDENGLSIGVSGGHYRTIDVSDYTESATISVCYTGQRRYLAGYITMSGVTGAYYYSVFATLSGISNGKATERYVLAETT